MTKENKHIPPLYANIVDVDEKTGLPADYNSLFAMYRDVVKGSAGRLRIPATDQEDAAQEVQIKFWLKNGLGMFDASKGKFATLYRKWSYMFMLQERDKSLKLNSRYAITDPQDMREQLENEPVSSFESDWIQNDYLNEWITEAEQALHGADAEHLIPLLRLCVATAELGRHPSRAEIAEATGVKLAKSTALVKELRETLTKLGMGMETLYA